MPSSKSPLPLLVASLIVSLLLASCAKKQTELHATFETSMGDIVVRLLSDQAPKTVDNFVGLARGTRLLADGEPPENAEPFYDGLTFHRVIPDFMIQGGDPQGDGSGGPGYSFEDETYTPGELIEGQIEDLDTAEYVFEQIIAPHLRENLGNSPNDYIAQLFSKMRESQSIDPMLGESLEDIKAAVGFNGPFYAKGELIDEVRYGTLCMANAGPNTNGSQFFIVTREEGVPSLNGRHTVFGEVISGMDVAKAIADAPKEANIQGELSKPIDPVVIKSLRISEVQVVASKED